jgi:hypothetical protein
VVCESESPVSRNLVANDILIKRGACAPKADFNGAKSTRRFYFEVTEPFLAGHLPLLVCSRQGNTNTIAAK